MTEHRKSHPPETSLSSRELAERLFDSIPRPTFDPKLSKELKDYLDRDLVKNTAIQNFSALIEAWVRVREAQILEEVALSFERLYWKLDGAIDAAKCVRAFATARKQLEET